MIVERTYRARVEDVWDLWATAEGFASWWGPVGYHVDVRELDARVGGALRYDMVPDEPGGLSHATHGTFTELTPRRRLAIRHVIDFLPDVDPYDNVIAVELLPLAGSVRMVVTLSPMHSDEFTAMQEEGFASQLTKLEKRFGRARLEGGCGCGAVRYQLASPPMFVNCCHCRECQAQTGSAFVINAIIEADRITVEGAAPIPVTMKTDSGRPHQIFRCPTCQTALWSIYGGRAEFRFVRVGTLDDPGALPPDAHIFVRSKLPWLELPASQPQFDVFYDMETQWPAASRARRDAAMRG